MKESKAPAAIGITMKDAPPQAVDAGANYSFSVAITWPKGVDSGCATFSLRDGERILHEGALPKAGEEGGVRFEATAPEEVGEHHVNLAISVAGDGRGESAEGALGFVVTTVPHAASLAVWDVRSPVVRGTQFEIKIGAKCTASCKLGGAGVEVRDESGVVRGTGALGTTTWEGTSALYWTTVSLQAPRVLGLQNWRVSFSPSEMKLPHDGSTSRFTFVTVAEPEHSVSVKVVDKKTKAPIGGAQVRLGLFRAVTDEKGSARVEVPKGEFPLIVTRAGYEMPERKIKVSKDVRVRVGGEALPEEDPFAAWTA